MSTEHMLLDYSKKFDGFPKLDVLKFLLEDNCSIVVRPSGTEPKVKAYIFISATMRVDAEILEQSENKIILYIRWLNVADKQSLSITVWGTVFTQSINFETAFWISSREWKNTLLITESFSQPYSSSILFKFGL